jgi:uncharacterized protein YjiK
MRKLILDILVVNMMLGVATLVLASPSHAQYVITEIIDSTGDGAGNALDLPWGIAVDSNGNVYVAGEDSDNVFKITPGGTITEIIDSTGDGAGNALDEDSRVAVDSNGNVYVTGAYSDNAFKITPGGTITEIIDSTGDGAGNALGYPRGLAVDSSGNVYVTGYLSDNAFKIATPGTCSTTGTPCTITEIIDATGDGGGNALTGPWGIAVDSSGNVYMASRSDSNVFKIATPGTCSTTGTPCTITEIIDATGDGGGNTLDTAEAVAVDSNGNVYVAGLFSYNAFKIATPGTCSTTGTPCAITEIIDATGGGGWNELEYPRGVAVDSSGNVYVTGQHMFGNGALEIATPGTCGTTGTPCTMTEIIDNWAAGAGKTLFDPRGVAVDSSGNVYVTGYKSLNAFKIQPVSQVPALSNRGLVLLGASLLCVVWWVARRRRLANA